MSSNIGAAVTSFLERLIGLGNQALGRLTVAALAGLAALLLALGWNVFSAATLLRLEISILVLFGVILMMLSLLAPRQPVKEKRERPARPPARSRRRAAVADEPATRPKTRRRSRTTL